MANIKQIQIASEIYDVEDTTARTTLETKESTSNKSTSVSNTSTDTQYPSAKAVYTKVENSKLAVAVDSEKLILGNGENKPLELSTDDEMSAVLISDNEYRVYKFTGTSSTYVTGDLYMVVSSGSAYSFNHYYAES